MAAALDTPFDVLAQLSGLASTLQARLAQAGDVDSLQAPALQIAELIASLHRAGCSVAAIAEGVRILNAALFARAWHLIAPPELVANCCLFVMGSEGRGEQILKTDQDNGLVLGDASVDDAVLARACEQFSQALRSFGYPDCPGGIMVSNALWRLPVGDFTRLARRWLAMPDAEGLMSLAIFLDARPVCGNPALLERVRDEVFELAATSDAMLARFAAAIEAFSESSGWWNRWLPNADHGKHEVDIKKLGMFPLVHGVRSLALAHHVRETGTVGRLAALQAAGVLSPVSASDLVDSLHVFMQIKLKAGLADTGAPGFPHAVRLEDLSTLDRSSLEAALGVVRQFKAVLRQRFHLDALA